MKHGFMIMAHGNFGQLKEIIGLLAAPNHYFFVNIDKKVADMGGVIEECKALSDNMIFLDEKERTAVAHGGFSLVVATLKLLHKAQEAGMDYCHLISGADYPCQSNRAFDEFFEKNEGRSYMLFDTQEQHDEWIKEKYPKRLRYYYLWDLPHREIRLWDLAIRAVGRIVRLVPLRPMPKFVDAGWNWFSWHRQVVDFVLEQERTNAAFFRRFHWTHCCDELVFHTLLSPYTEQLNIERANSLRYINWTKPKDADRQHLSGPLSLNEKEYDEIVASGAFFCRKVHPDVSEKLKEMLRARMV